MADSRKIIALLALAALFGTSGCSVLPPVEFDPAVNRNAADRLVPATHQAVDRLLTSFIPGTSLAANRPVIVATLVNNDDLNGSRFGRLLSEQIGTRLTQKGYPVIELKLREAIFMRQLEGELLLSRNVQDVSLNHSAQAVLVGTYTEARGFVYVTMKIVEPGENKTIAAHDYALPLDRTVRSMLTKY
ncbi:FlgO family outer membrane protein [Geobacter sp. DSM 9736]|uniref:FlgO family outer membrane protein n=1 Tax=Geobacter sp. DSM 9736 TaxID=1277350 RepID=UPI000B604634|nr:FlgO family outer membrane protein [Geobacter sp. DSM 9736]SNB46078.1 hypothetical protein SAMN06269301_1518 [Geobacter sp. DSM 9736]